MDISLDLFAKYLKDNSSALSDSQLSILIEFLETQKTPHSYAEFSIDLFLSSFQKNLPFSNENLIAFVMLFGDFTQKNIKILEDKQKLEIFSYLSSKIKNQKLDINVFYETFLWISIQMSLIYELFPELQDFNDYHKKIKAKIHEDIRFYNKFIETALELSGKFNTFKEFSCLLKYFLKNLSKIIKKCPFLFKTTMNPLQVNLLRVLAKPNFESTSKNSIKCYVFLTCYCVAINNPEKIPEILMSYIENLAFLFKIVKSSQDNFEINEENSIKFKFLFDKSLLFQGKTRLSTQRIVNFSIIISQIFKKTLKNLPENEAFRFDIQNFLRICEEIIVSDQNFIENVEKDENKVKNLLSTGFLQISEYILLSFHMKKEILKILKIFCQIGKTMLLKYLDWLQNAIYFIGMNYKKYMDVFTSNIQLLNTCIKIYQMNFLKFSRNFIVKTPDLLNILLHSLEYFSCKSRKISKMQTNSKMVLSKKAKNKKNKTHNVISLNESIKESNPFEYLQKIDKKSLNKFIIKALKVIDLEMSILGRFETENANILRYEEFFYNILKIFQNYNKSTHFLKYLLNIGENLLYANKIKGENFGFAIKKFDLFLDKYIKKPGIEKNFTIKILKIKQKIQDIKNQNKITYLNSFNNSIVLNDYIEKQCESINHNKEIFEDINNFQEKEIEVDIEKKIQKESEKILDIVEEIEVIHEFQKETHQELDFVGKNERFYLEKTPAKEKKFEFIEIADMPKAVLDDD